MEDLLQYAIRYARDKGANYAEARYQEDIKEVSLLKNGVPEITGLQIRKGVAIRVIVNGALAFSSVNKLTKADIRKAVLDAINSAKATLRKIKNPIILSDEKLFEDKVILKPRIKFESIDPEDRMLFLKEIDDTMVKTVEAKGAKLPSRFLNLILMDTIKNVITSDGANIFSHIPRVFLEAFLTIFHQQKGVLQRFKEIGESNGWEAIERWNLIETFDEEALILTESLLEAKEAKKGIMDVILGPEIIGLVCHESSGHPQEADRILGREAAQAGETYLKPKDIGLKVGSEYVTIIDDPTLPNSYGFYLYDDEGVKARPRILIDKGVINEFLHNRETAKVFNTNSNAASRAVAYDKEPIVRMANTYMKPGEYSFEELIEDIKDGIYMKFYQEWNIDDRRFNQKYVGSIAYRIENGELKEMVRNPSLEITTIGLFSAIDAVGKDLKFTAAICGKGDPMQGCPVWVGGPHVRLRNVRI
jgi:TldD protein